MNHMVTCHDMGHTLAYISKVIAWGRLGFPFNNVFQLWFVNTSNLKICPDANKNAKSGKIIRIFHFQVRAVTVVSEGSVHSSMYLQSIIYAFNFVSHKITAQIRASILQCYT